MNQVTLIGNIGNDAELRYTQNQIAILSFNLATAKKVKEEFKTTWHRIVFWGTKATELEPFLKKGARVLVIGEIETREYTDKSGQKKSITEINAKYIAPLVRPHTKEEAQPVKPARTQWQPPQMTDEDIPF